MSEAGPELGLDLPEFLLLELFVPIAPMFLEQNLSQKPDPHNIKTRHPYCLVGAIDVSSLPFAAFVPPLMASAGSLLQSPSVRAQQEGVSPFFQAHTDTFLHMVGNRHHANNM